MLKHKILTTTILLIMIPCVFSYGAASSKNNTVFKLIDEDYQSGQLSLDQKALLQIQAIKNYDKLPDKYLTADLSPGDLRGATLALIEIKKDWDKLSPDTRAQLSQTLARFPTEFIYESPSGFFKLHYDTFGSNAVPSEDLDSDNIPDFIEKVAAYCDTTLQTHLDWGYMTPPPDNNAGGDNKYDIYFEDISYYGYTVPEDQGIMPWDDYFSYIVLNSDFVEFPFNNDPEGQVEGAAKATIAHEFHHAIQLAYDIFEGSWYMELDATYAEDLVFEVVDDNYNYLDGFFNTPQTSLMDNNPNHKYSCFVWNIFLTEKFDHSLIPAFWEGARYDNIFNTMTDTLYGRYNYDIDSLFSEFTRWNFITSFRNDGLHYSEADFYPLINIGRQHSTYPVNLINSPSSVSGYASNYITFYPGIKTGDLRITFDGSNSRQWKAYIIKSNILNSHEEIEYISLDPVEYNGEIVVADMEQYYSVTLVGVNTSELTSGALFTYSASFLLPYSMSSQLLTLDTIIYSGSSRIYEYLIRNEASVYDVFSISFWDDQGWLPFDTLQRSIQGGDSLIISLNLYPPPGTPVDVISNLYFNTVSWGNPEISDSHTISVKSALYRGDLNSSGEVDIEDIVYFVAYSFEHGPAPIPNPLSADFDCSNEVDIEDLVKFVEYSFEGGPPCQCNPY